MGFRCLVRDHVADDSSSFIPRALPWWSYTRSPDKIGCDVFAAELLLPFRVFTPFVEEWLIGFDAVDSMAARFLASNTATGSRYRRLLIYRALLYCQKMEN